MLPFQRFGGLSVVRCAGYRLIVAGRMVQRLGGGCAGGGKNSLDLPGMKDVRQRRAVATTAPLSTRLLWGIWLGSSAVVLVVAVEGRDVTANIPTGKRRMFVSARDDRVQRDYAHSGPMSGSEALSWSSATESSDSDLAMSSLSSAEG